MTDKIPVDRQWIIGAVISVIGLSYHQLQEFPGEYSFAIMIVLPMVVILAILIRGADRKTGQLGLLVYGLIHLIGGGLSVFPFDFLPFVPEQSTGHYLSHVIYAITQLPLIYQSVKQLAEGSIDGQ